MSIELVGTAEIATMLGLSKQRTHQLTKSKHFPLPLARLRCGPVWDANSIRAFDRLWLRKPGRPAKVNTDG